MSGNYNLSIVLPCYNAADRWILNVADSFDLIQNQIGNIEIILVNDGSSKNFNEIEVRAFFSRYSAVKTISYFENKGKGYALREGVKAAQGDLVIYTDVDFPYTIESFLQVYTSLKNEDIDVAIGIRGKDYYNHLPKARVQISKLLRWCIQTFLRIPTDDTQCGLKGFNQKGKEVFLQTTINRYLFDLEFIFLSARQKLNIKTIPVELRPEIRLSTMNFTILLQEFGNFLKIFVRSI